MAIPKGILTQQNQQQAMTDKSPAALMNELIDQEGIKNRINEILGKRAPQFTASLVSVVNASEAMQEVLKQNPVTIIQAALKAAAYDLPIDPSLGFAHIVPFNETDKTTGKKSKKASFIIGYKGLLQLAMRTGAYKKINVIDVRQGELVSYDRLTEDIELDFLQDEEEREQLPIIGFVGYFRLTNGMEKILYMSIAAIKNHEKAHRKGKYINDNWKDTPENQNNFRAMCAKTILRKLIGKWGLMSIDYQNASPDVIALAENVAKGTVDDADDGYTINVEAVPTEPAPTPTGNNVPPQDFIVPMD